MFATQCNLFDVDCNILAAESDGADLHKVIGSPGCVSRDLCSIVVIADRCILCT